MSLRTPDDHTSAALRSPSFRLRRVKEPSLPSMTLLVGLLAVLSGCGQGPSDSCPPDSEPCDMPPGEQPGPSQSWSSAGSTSTFRIGHTASLLPNGKVLLVGGVTPSPQKNQNDTAELYDPKTGTWSLTGSLTHGRVQHTATLLPDGKVLVTGGAGPFPVAAEVYDPGTGTWSPAGSLAMDRTAPTATLLQSGKVLVVGGSPFPTVEVYTP